MSKKEEQDGFLQKEVAIGGINMAQKAQFVKNLSVMQRSGLTIVESLEIITESATGKLKKILKNVLGSVKSGNSLSVSFARHPKIFSGMFISAIYAGEQSGSLLENLENLAEQLEKEKELMSKVKGAMLYPIVILIASLILGLAMSFLVLPKIIPLFEGLKTDLPLTTRWLITFSHFVDNHGTALFASVVVAVVLFLWFIKQKFSHPLTHWLLLKIPIIKNIVINANLARFSRTLGMLLKSGLNIDEALQIVEKTLGNYYYKKIVKSTSDSVSRGLRLSENLENSNKKLFPKMTTRMIYVGEQSGKLEETLLYLAGYYELEVDNDTKTLSTAIEPVLLLFIGLLVGFLALSIITPIYNITGNIKR